MRFKYYYSQKIMVFLKNTKSITRNPKYERIE